MKLRVLLLVIFVVTVILTACDCKGEQCGGIFDAIETQDAHVQETADAQYWNVKATETYGAEQFHQQLTALAPGE